MRQDPSRVYPATSDIRRHLAASGCGRGSGDYPRMEAHKPMSGMVNQVERRAWDSNPRARSPLLAVFKTSAVRALTCADTITQQISPAILRTRRSSAHLSSSCVSQPSLGEREDHLPGRHRLGYSRSSRAARVCPPGRAKRALVTGRFGGRLGLP
jgi:hypothetical protein